MILGMIQIKAHTLFIFVLDPPSLLQGPFDVTISTSHYKHFGLIVNPIFFLPSGHIGNVQEDLICGYITVNKRLHRSFGFFRFLLRRILAALYMAFFISTVLKFTKAWRIFELFRLLDHLLACKFK